MAPPGRRARRRDHGRYRRRLIHASQGGTAGVGDYVAECYYHVDGGAWRRGYVLGVRPMHAADEAVARLATCGHVLRADGNS